MQFFRQIHKKSKRLQDGTEIPGDKEKGYRGKGGFKTVWKILPFYRMINKATTSGPEYVRMRFLERKDYKTGLFIPLTDDEMRSIIANLEMLKQEMGNHPLLLLPTTFVYTRSKGRGTAVTQIMPEMKGDLYKHYRSLSRIGRLRVAAKMARVLGDLHEKGIAHLDFKLENVMLEEGGDRDNTKVRLADFDTTCKIEQGEKIGKEKGSPLFQDPNILTQDPKRADLAKGPEAAAVADQCSWGIAFFELLCEADVRDEKIMRNEILNGEPITESQLESNETYRGLPPELKSIICDCVVGIKRQPKMHQIAELLDDYIDKLARVS